MDQSKLKNRNILQAEENFSVPEVKHAASLRCPHCSHIGSFTSVYSRTFAYTKRFDGSSTPASQPFNATIRMCPNPQCNGLVMTIETSKDLLRVLPPERLDFDSSNLPAVLADTLEEAVACHAAGAYRAAAMMVRRLLEEMCDDSGATGKNLHQRLEDLKSKVVLPTDLFDVMGELKALGNDAAHIQAKSYDTIGQDEAADSIELAKEILKARYQLKGLLARLQARKSAP